jgi:hypothetical protein
MEFAEVILSLKFEKGLKKVGKFNAIPDGFRPYGLTPDP